MKHLSAYILIVSLSFVLAACSDDPSPERFTPPVISSVSATVGKGVATLSCSFSNPSGTGIRSCGFLYWPENSQKREVPATISGNSFSCTLNDLSKGAQYECKAWVSSGIDTVFSEAKAFETLPGDPLISAPRITERKWRETTVQYDIEDSASGNLLSYGLCWGKHPGLTIENSTHDTESGGEYGLKSFTITDCDPGTCYLRAFAVAESGTWYSEEAECYVPVIFRSEALQKYMLTIADTDGNGEISLEEASAVTSVDITSNEIETLEGLEYCTGLKSLRCAGTLGSDGASLGKLTSVNVSHNPELYSIDLSYNNIESFSAGILAVRSLNLSHNAFTSISLASLPTMESVNLSSNSLTGIDLSSNVALVKADLSGNEIHEPKLPPSVEELDISDTKVSDLNGLFKLHRNIKRLLVKGIASDETRFALLPELKVLDCSGSDMASLKLTFNTKLQSLRADGCKMHTLDVNLNDSLQSLSCRSSHLDTLYLMEDQLIEGVNIGDGGRSGLLDNTVLGYTARVKDSAFGEYLLDNFDSNHDGIVSLAEAREVTGITIDGSKYSGVTSLHGLEMFHYLRKLDIAGQSVSSIDLKTVPKLETLVVDKNPLTSLDLQYCTGLRYIYCQSSNITAIDLSPCKKLEKAFFRFSHITGTLDARECVRLRYLDVRDTDVVEVILPQGSTTTVMAGDGVKVSYRAE